jgi:hypothetical protein
MSTYTLLTPPIYCIRSLYLYNKESKADPKFCFSLGANSFYRIALRFFLDFHIDVINTN